MGEPLNLEEKWKKLMREARHFRHVPFLEFVFASGSMALGTAKASSDFDVIVGAKKGRIFTVRFFSILIFEFAGSGRRAMDGAGEAADKICLNHFVTENSYQLSPPYNDYWRALYPRLVPIFGDQMAMERFFSANQSWAGPRLYSHVNSHYQKSQSGLARFFEAIFSGAVGDAVERLLRNIQVRRIERGVEAAKATGYKPRIKYTDDELEFHPIGEKELPRA